MNDAVRRTGSSVLKACRHLSRKSRTLHLHLERLTPQVSDLDCFVLPARQCGTARSLLPLWGEASLLAGEGIAVVVDSRSFTVLHGD